MSWVYSDYRSAASDALRLERARLHAQEITDAVQANVSKDGASRSSDHLVQLLDRVETDIRRYERAVRNPFTVVRRGMPGG